MNRNDIIRMVKEAGFMKHFIDPEPPDWITDNCERFAALVAAAEREAYQNVHRLLEVHQAALEASEKPGPWPAKEVIAKAVAAEREACARVCDEKREEWGWDDDGQLAARDCANAIRARGNET